MSIIQTNIFRDIDLTFSQNIKHDIAKVIDLNAIKQAVKIIVCTRHKPFEPFWGPGLAELIGENFDPVKMAVIEDDIAYHIRQKEPRVLSVKIHDLSDIDNGLLHLDIYFKVKDNKDVEVVSIVIDQVR